MLLGVITANPLGVLVAFGAGILSFLSPCVLPLVPGYLSMVSGLTPAELGRRRPHDVDEAPTGRSAAGLVAVSAAVGSPPRATAFTPGSVVATIAPTPVPGDTAASLTGSVNQRPMKPLIRGILLFIAGFTLVFVVSGAAASSLGHLLGTHKQVLTTASGAIVLALGLILLIGSLPASLWARVGGRVSGRLAFLVGERRFHVQCGTLGAWTAPVMGMAFAFAWTPCIGPVLGAVLALAYSRSTLAGGMLLLFAYSMGLGVPFVVTGVAFERLTTLYAKARAPLAIIQVFAAGVLVAFGALVLAGDLGWLSAQFNALLNDFGLHCSTTSGCFA